MKITTKYSERSFVIPPSTNNISVIRYIPRDNSPYKYTTYSLFLFEAIIHRAKNKKKM